MTYSVQDHIKLKRVTSIAASPDGRWLAVAAQRLDRDGAKYVGDIWKVPTDGSTPMQLTRGDTQDQRLASVMTGRWDFFPTVNLTRSNLMARPRNGCKCGFCPPVEASRSSLPTNLSVSRRFSLRKTPIDSCCFARDP